mgnify:CR=1 FL=1
MSKKPRNYKTKGIGAGIIAFGGIFALFSSLFGPRSLGGYLLTLVVSALGGAIVRVMAQGLDLSTPQAQEQKEPESLQNVAQDTGIADVDALLQKGREMITEIRTENAKIPDAGLTQKLNQLETMCSRIFQCVYEKPAKASQIRKFMDYYLPTTLKMVKAYRVLGERNLSSDETRQARQRIDSALGIVLTGCQKQLDNLYRDDVLDITTDIDVLEQMLKRDGLTESDLDLAAEAAKQAAQVASAEAAAYKARQQTAQQVVAQTSAPAAQRDPTQWYQDSQTNVSQSIQQTQQQATTHVPSVPVLHPSELSGAGAMAQAPKQQQ